MSVTYNCGLGMIAIVPKDKADEICSTINVAAGETATIIGQVIKTDAENRVEIINMDTEWAA